MCTPHPPSFHSFSPSPIPAVNWVGGGGYQEGRQTADNDDETARRETNMGEGDVWEEGEEEEEADVC